MSRQTVEETQEELFNLIAPFRDKEAADTVSNKDTLKDPSDVANKKYDATQGAFINEAKAEGKDAGSNVATIAPNSDEDDTMPINEQTPKTRTVDEPLESVSEVLGKINKEDANTTEEKVASVERLGHSILDVFEQGITRQKQAKEDYDNMSATDFLLHKMASESSSFAENVSENVFNAAVSKLDKLAASRDGEQILSELIKRASEGATIVIGPEGEGLLSEEPCEAILEDSEEDSEDKEDSEDREESKEDSEEKEATLRKIATALDAKGVTPQQLSELEQQIGLHKVASELDAQGITPEHLAGLEQQIGLHKIASELDAAGVTPEDLDVVEEALAEGDMEEGAEEKIPEELLAGLSEEGSEDVSEGIPEELVDGALEEEGPSEEEELKEQLLAAGIPAEALEEGEKMAKDLLSKGAQENEIVQASLELMNGKPSIQVKNFSEKQASGFSYQQKKAIRVNAIKQFYEASYKQKGV